MATHDDCNLSERQLSVLMEEYRALYGLLGLRLGSLERRAPIAGATLAAFMGSITILPDDAQAFVLIGLPIALIWYVRSTITHALSFEDLLRRIEQIELQANELAGAACMRFQSSHPSKNKSVGGRVSRETILSVAGIALLIMLGCALLWIKSESMVGESGTIAYLVLVCAVVIYLLNQVRNYSRYAYLSPSE